jgi:hypothetical protein
MSTPLPRKRLQSTAHDGYDGHMQKKCRDGAFTEKTFQMINLCHENEEYCNWASWTPDGKMFVIKDQEEFAAKIIPKYFDAKQFSSFVRQLNMYGFHKMMSKSVCKDDIDAGTANYVTYFHQYFQRGQPNLLDKIIRSTNKGLSGTHNQDQQQEIAKLKRKVNQYECTISTIQNENAALRASLERIYSTNSKYIARRAGLERIVSAIHNYQNISESTTSSELPLPVTESTSEHDVTSFSAPRTVSDQSEHSPVGSSHIGNNHVVNSHIGISNVGSSQTYQPYKSYNREQDMDFDELNSLLDKVTGCLKMGIQRLQGQLQMNSNRLKHDIKF